MIIHIPEVGILADNESCSSIVGIWHSKYDEFWEIFKADYPSSYYDPDEMEEVIIKTVLTQLFGRRYQRQGMLIGRLV